MTSAETRARTARRRGAGFLLARQIGYQLRVLVRSPLGSFVTLVVPLMVLLAVSLLYKGNRLETRGGIAYTQFFTPAMVAFAVVNACYMSVISQITLARDEGILKRIRSTPLPPWIYMAGRFVAAGLVALVSAVAVVAVGAGVYDFHVVWSALPAALATTVFAMFCFSALGLAVTVLVPSADAAFPFAWGTILPLCFVSDVFIPIDEAPRWLRDVASAFPLRPFADDLEYAFNPVRGGTGLHLEHLALLAAWGVGAAAFALVAFRWQPDTGGRRRGGHHAAATFAIERVRSLLETRTSPMRLPAAAGPTHPPTLRPPRRRTKPPARVERIEGPAPGEDSSVPREPPP